MSKITIRHNIRDNFTMITNEFARDPHVTPRAAKVYLYLMSHSEGWETSAERIHKALGMGLTTVKEALKDLEKLGYLQRGQERNPDGTMGGSSYDLFSEPQTIERKANHGATSENGANPQVNTGVWKTDGGLADGGNPTPIRRPIPKKTKKQEDQDKTPLTPQGGNDNQPGNEIDIFDATVVDDQPTPKKTETRGHRLPDNWMPTQESIGKMYEEFPELTEEALVREHRKFSDYWPAKAGRAGVKKDWDATWRNWIRTAMERNQPRKPQAQRQQQGSRFAGMSMAEISALAKGQASA